LGTDTYLGALKSVMDPYAHDKKSGRTDAARRRKECRQRRRAHLGVIDCWNSMHGRRDGEMCGSRKVSRGKREWTTEDFVER
jgi:hypothetical protein